MRERGGAPSQAVEQSGPHRDEEPFRDSPPAVSSAASDSASSGILSDEYVGAQNDGVKAPAGVATRRSESAFCPLGAPQIPQAAGSGALPTVAVHLFVLITRTHVSPALAFTRDAAGKLSGGGPRSLLAGTDSNPHASRVPSEQGSSHGGSTRVGGGT